MPLPDAYQRITEFSQYKRADQTAGRYLLEFGALRRKAEARVIIGAACSEASVAILRMHNAALSKEEK